MKEKILETMEVSDVTELEAFQTKLKLKRSSVLYKSILTKSAIKIILGLTFFSFFMTIEFFMPANFNPFVFYHFLCDIKTYYFECLDYPGYILRILGMESLEILLNI